MILYKRLSAKASSLFSLADSVVKRLSDITHVFISQ